MRLRLNPSRRASLPPRPPGALPRALSASALLHVGALAGSVWILGSAPALLAGGPSAEPSSMVSIPRARAVHFEIPPPESTEPEADEPLPEPRLEPLAAARADLEPAPVAPLPDFAPVPDWRTALARVPSEALAPIPTAPEPLAAALADGAAAEPPAESVPEAAPPETDPEPAAATAVVAEAAAEAAAVLIASPKPDYPRASLRFGEEGTALCRMWVDGAGRVARVALLESSGHERLDRAALEALRTWRFRPATRAGLPVASTVDHEVEFRLQGR